MSQHFADRTLRAIQDKRAPVCIGIDPLWERLPAGLLDDHGIVTDESGRDRPEPDRKISTEAIKEFGREVIRVVAGYVPIVKINIAFFERYHAEGLQAYHDLVSFASQTGLIVIGDVKRADIGHSATQYARAQLGPSGPAAIALPDAVTVNPYFGRDGVEPFIDIARRQGQGVFVLVQTSNESSGEVQGLVSDGVTVAERVARLVQGWAQSDGLLGESGYSCVGAVVSPHDAETTQRIRKLMPHCLFLVPGFGAQGRTAEDVAHCFKADGTGAIVTASRSVIYAYRNETYRKSNGEHWIRCVEQACRDFVRAVSVIV